VQTGAARTHYQTLGVAPEATADEIRAAYRTQIRLVHPDVAGPDGAPRAAELSAAYAVLSKPDQRLAYDASLRTDRPPAEEEFADGDADWGTPVDWENDDEPAHRRPTPEETLDDVVVEGAEPDTTGNTRTEAADSDRPFGWMQSRTGPAPDLRFRYPARGLIIYATAGLVLIMVAGLLPWLTWTSDAILTRTQTAGVAAGAGVLGLLIGYVLPNRSPNSSSLSSQEARSLSLSKGPIGPIPAVIAAAVLIIIGEVSVPSPWLSLVRLAYVGALAITLGLLLQDRISRQRGLNAVLPISVLRRNNVFGSQSGEVAADRFERDCDPLYSIPGLRIVRTPAPDALFTHVFVCGSKVAFARAVVADGGSFRWSGPTLFRDGAEGWPTEVLRGPYEEACRRMPSALGKRTEVRCWILVYPPDRADVQQAPDPLLPSVQSAAHGIDAIGRYLSNDNVITVVDQQRVVAAADVLYG
jgi:hypothetical protein